jgi:hypothetical protein
MRRTYPRPPHALIRLVHQQGKVNFDRRLCAIGECWTYAVRAASNSFLPSKYCPRESPTANKVWGKDWIRDTRCKRYRRLTAEVAMFPARGFRTMNWLYARNADAILRYIAGESYSCSDVDPQGVQSVFRVPRDDYIRREDAINISSRRRRCFDTDDPEFVRAGVTCNRKGHRDRPSFPVPGATL